jgi:dihydroorotate dehydrogenase electron transfer subunit
MPLFETTIVATRDVAPDYFQLDFEWPDGVEAPLPGQFLTIRVADTSAPLLRRPFGFSGFRSGPDGATASTIYWRRGAATRILAGYEPGEKIDVMAPLGVGFPTPRRTVRPLLVAGGIGVGPVLFLANTLAELGFSPLLLIGARTAAQLPEIQIDERVHCSRATDDGSSGFRGTAIGLLEQTLATVEGDREIFLCGPNVMLREGHRCAERHGVRAWVAMEQTMGCAVGACMGCAVRVHGPQRFARVCTEGPVFRSTEIVWE